MRSSLIASVSSRIRVPTFRAAFSSSRFAQLMVHAFSRRKMVKQIKVGAFVKRGWRQQSMVFFFQMGDTKS